MRKLLITTLILIAGLAASCGSNYVRLRGSPEIHEPDCPRVRRAAADGVVDAGSDDGPPCFDCRREEAVEWSRDPD